MTRRFTIVLLALAAIGLVAWPAQAQNLIPRPGFEWTILDPVTNDWSHDYGATAGWPQFNQTVWGPAGGAPIAGSYYISFQDGDTEPLNPKIYSKVPINVTPGSEYLFAGHYAGGYNAGGNRTGTVFMRIIDGSSYSGTTVLAEASKYINRVNSGFGWETFAVYFTAQSSQCVVVFGTNVNTPYYPHAIHADELSLTLVGVPPVTQPALTAITANDSVDIDLDATGVTISGSNLDNTGGTVSVKLVAGHLQGGDQEITGTIQTQSASQLVVDFALSGGDYRIGKYDVVVEKTGHNPRKLPLAFTITCPVGDQSFLTTYNNRGLSGDPNVHTLGITVGGGTDVQYVSNIQLVKLKDKNGALPGNEVNPIVGTNIRQPGGVGTDILVDFDLSPAGGNPEGGRYSVQVDVAHPCNQNYVNVVSGFSRDFLMYMPLNTTLHANGSPLIFQNPSFEEGYLPDGSAPFCDAGYTGENPKPLHWDQVIDQEVKVGSWSRDKALGWDNGVPPGCDGNIANRDGLHYEDQTQSSTNNEQTIAFFQTVDASSLLDGNNDLIEELTVRAALWFHPGGSLAEESDAWIELLDGTEGGTLVGTSAEIEATAYTGLDAQEAYAATIPATTHFETNLLTLRFRAHKAQTADPQFLILRVDDVRSGPFFTCNVPWADTDVDGDVDQDDFGVMQDCITGAGLGIPTDPTYCNCLDANGDTDITQSDVTAFEACATGPDVDYVLGSVPACE
jgi:hypothetical protein